MPTFSEWADIETAPKDGRRLLLWDRRGVEVIGNYDDRPHVRGWFADDGEVVKPTHWMPLPKPPEGPPMPR